jgi:O-antigen/teichoic acid export membrane protein
MPSVGQRLVKSASWSISGDLLTALSSAAALIVAARFVPKAEIGLVAVVMLMLALVETLTASGVEQALVQRPKDDVASLLDTAWTWQFGRGLCIGVCLVLSAPLLARFYDEPALAPLACVLAVQPVLRGATNIALVLKLRALDFRAAFALSVLPAVTRLAVVVPLSLSWRSAWALVAAALAEHVVRLLLSFALMPRRPRLRMRWSELAPLLRYGRWLTGMSILAYVTTRGDDVFISKYFGAADLALYQLAFGVASVPVTAITHVLGRLTFPVYARLHEQAGELRLAFQEMLRLTTLFALVVAAAIWPKNRRAKNNLARLLRGVVGW